MAAIEITKDNFDAEVLESPKTVLIDFWAPWCGPCKMLAPIIEKIAEEAQDVKVCKINVDENQELAMKYQVMAIPTLVVIKNGEVVNRSTGVISKQEILNMLEK